MTQPEDGVAVKLYCTGGQAVTLPGLTVPPASALPVTVTKSQIAQPGLGRVADTTRANAQATTRAAAAWTTLARIIRSCARSPCVHGRCLPTAPLPSEPAPTARGYLPLRSYDASVRETRERLPGACGRRRPAALAGFARAVSIPAL